MANIITKKYLKCDDEKNKKEDNIQSEKLSKEELREKEQQEDERVFKMEINDKLKLERFIVPGPEILKDWKTLAMNNDEKDPEMQQKIRDYFRNISCI